MDIREGLAASLIPDFETAVSQVPLLLASFDDQSAKGLLADTLSVEIFALTLLLYGSSAQSKHYLQQPKSRLADKTPLACIKEAGPQRERVITDLLALAEGYVF